MFSNIIWGVLLILLGISLLAKSLFGVAIPIFRFILAGMLIYAGISLILSLKPIRNRESVVFFNQKKFDSKADDKDYSTVFGTSTLDLSDIEIKEKPTIIDVNVIFGSSTLKIDSEIPTVVKINTAFGSAQLPDDTMITFGKYTYKTPGTSDDPEIVVNANVVFGKLEVKNS